MSIVALVLVDCLAMSTASKVIFLISFLIVSAVVIQFGMSFSCVSARK